MNNSLLPEPSDYYGEKKPNEPETLKFIPFKDCDAELVASWGEFVYGGVTHESVNHFLGSLVGYRSIIKGVSDVNITFRTTCTPSFNMNSRTVYIPIKPLNEGGFDESVCSVVHELMHASDSPEFVDLVYLLYKQLLRSCKHIIDKDSNTLVYYSLGNHDPATVSAIDIVNLLREKVGTGRSNSNKTPDIPVFSKKGIKFVVACIQTAFTIWNSFEDIRIDYLTPEALKKYRLKSEQITWHKKYREGFLKNLDEIKKLNNGVEHPLEVGLKSLLHFKGMADYSKELQPYNMEFSDIVDCGRLDVPNLIHDILKDNFLHMYAAIWEEISSDDGEENKDDMKDVISNIFDPSKGEGSVDEGIADEVFEKLAREEKSDVRYPGKDLVSENNEVGCIPSDKLVDFLDSESSYGESMLATITDGDNRLPSTSTQVLETLKNLRKMVMAKVDTIHYKFTSVVVDLFA
jgi:hypothetical protein